jgi:amino acid transporter
MTAWPGDAPAASSGDHDGVTVPPDPQAYDTERSAAARRRGLAAPYILGGRDPDQAAAEAEDRRNVRLLLIMVIAIILAGFVLGTIAALAGLDALVGNPG